MKRYEAVSSNNEQVMWLINCINVVGGCADVASKLKALDQPDLSDVYIDIAAHYTNAINDEAEEFTKPVILYLDFTTGKTAFEVSKESGIPAADVRKELRKLRRKGLVQKSSKFRWVRTMLDGPEGLSPGE